MFICLRGSDLSEVHLSELNPLCIYASIAINQTCFMEDKVSIINKTTEQTILFYEIFTFILY